MVVEATNTFFNHIHRFYRYLSTIIYKIHYCYRRIILSYIFTQICIMQLAVKNKPKQQSYFQLIQTKTYQSLILLNLIIGEGGGVREP